MVDPDIEILIKAARARAHVLTHEIIWSGARSVDVELLNALADRLEQSPTKSTSRPQVDGGTRANYFSCASQITTLAVPPFSSLTQSTNVAPLFALLMTGMSAIPYAIDNRLNQ
jgi:hypothetical protein